MPSYTRIITHSGHFHADDVLAVAILRDLVPDAELIRSRDQALLAGGLEDAQTVMVDVGWSYDPARLNFDHHQQQFEERRASGVPYASVGLVWANFGELWLERVLEITDADERAFVLEVVDAELIASVDAFDCGVVEGTHRVAGASVELRVPSVADVVGSYNPTWFETPDFDARFVEAAREASGLLRRQAWRTLAEARFRAQIEAADTGAPVLVLSVSGPWRRFVRDHHLVVVFPAVGEDGWLVQAVGDPSSTEFPPPLRVAYPKAWRGQPKDALRTLTGIEDMTFCHRAGFIAGATSRAGALALAHRLVDEGERP